MLVQNIKQIIKGIGFSALMLVTPAHAFSELEPAGLGVYTDTARDIYMAGLLMPPAAGLENVDLAPGPKAMEYRIATRRISSRGFSGTLLLQAEFGSGERAPDSVVNVLSDLKASIQGSLLWGDRFVILLTEQEQTVFYLNDRELLSVDDGTIFDFFLSGWVGDSASAILRDSLLAGALDPSLLARFEALGPTDERIATIAQWTLDSDQAAAEEEQKVAAAAAAEKAASDAAEAAAVAAAASASVAANTVAVAEAASKPAAATLAVAAAELQDDLADDLKEDASVPEASAATVEAAPVQLASLQPINIQPILDDRDYQRQISEYTGTVMRQVFSNVRYPRRAVKYQREGNVDVLAYVSSDGELLDVMLDQSSGYGPLDNAALTAVKKAAPFPQLNNAAQEEYMTEEGDRFVMAIPVKFILAD